MDKKVKKLASRFWFSDCKWPIDAPKQNAALLAWTGRITEVLVGEQAVRQVGTHAIRSYAATQPRWNLSRQPASQAGRSAGRPADKQADMRQSGRQAGRQNKLKNEAAKRF